MSNYKDAIVENVLGVTGKHMERHQYQARKEPLRLTFAKKKRLKRLAKLFHTANR